MAQGGKPVNVDIVKRVRTAFTGVLEIGGGIRDKDAVDLYLGNGRQSRYSQFRSP